MFNIFKLTMKNIMNNENESFSNFIRRRRAKKSNNDNQNFYVNNDIVSKSCNFSNNWFDN